MVKPNLLDELQGFIHYQFTDVALLKQALATADIDGFLGVYPVKAYERLEFLGDRVLGLAMASYLFAEFKDETEGDIAKRHASLVCQKALVEVAHQHGLDVIVGFPPKPRTQRYASLMANTMEAIIGAVYLDGGFRAAEQSILTLWQPLMAEFMQAGPPKDPKTALQEWAQGKGHALPTYETIKTKGPAHATVFTVVVTVADFPPAKGQGRSKKIAAQEAASLMLEAIGNN